MEISGDKTNKGNLAGEFTFLFQGKIRALNRQNDLKPTYKHV